MTLDIFAIRYNAGNDSNGNPRRGWNIGAGMPGYRAPVGWIDEGYAGEDPLWAFVDRMREQNDDCTFQLVDTYPVQISAASHRALCKLPLAPPTVDGEIVTVAAAEVYGIRSYRRALPSDGRGADTVSTAAWAMREPLTERRALALLSHGETVLADAWTPRVRCASGAVGVGRFFVAITRV